MMIKKMKLIVMVILIMWVTTVMMMIRSLNLKRTPAHLNFWRLLSSNSLPPPWKKLLSNAPPKFYLKSKISNCDFQHTEQALKPYLTLKNVFLLNS